MDGDALTRRSLRTPRAAAIAGVLSALPLSAALALVRLATAADPGEAAAWLADPGRWRSSATSTTSTCGRPYAAYRQYVRQRPQPVRP